MHIFEFGNKKFLKEESVDNFYIFYNEIDIWCLDMKYILYIENYLIELIDKM